MLATTLRHLARDGLAGLSIAAVAADAGTTRPAVYRRWSSKEALAVAAVAHLAETDPPPAPTGEPFADLVAELEHFPAVHHRGRCASPGRTDADGRGEPRGS